MDPTLKSKRAREPRKPSVAGALGRPPSAVLRDRFVTFRVTAEEHFRPMDKARRSGLSAGEFARSRALRGIVRTKKKKAAADADWSAGTLPLVTAAMKLWHELHKIAINLNQIARHCNTYRVPPPPVFHDLMDALRDLLARLRQP